MPTRHKAVSRRSRATEAAPPAAAPEQTLHDILAPLAAMAVQTSLNAYQWGLKSHQLMRAGVVMDLCGAVIDEANQICGHSTGKRATVAVLPTPPLLDLGQLNAPNGPGPGPAR